MAKKEKKPNYNPPRDGIVFVRMWNQILPELRNRTNFNPAYHLRLLEILCNLFQDEDNLTDILDTVGMTYSTSGRNGDLTKPRPEIAQLNKTRSQIKQYSQILGFGISKTSKHPMAGEATAEASDEWD